MRPVTVPSSLCLVLLFGFAGLSACNSSGSGAPVGAAVAGSNQAAPSLCGWLKRNNMVFEDGQVAALRSPRGVWPEELTDIPFDAPTAISAIGFFGECGAPATAENETPSDGIMLQIGQAFGRNSTSWELRILETSSQLDVFAQTTEELTYQGTMDVSDLRVSDFGNDLIQITFLATGEVRKGYLEDSAVDPVRATVTFTMSAKDKTKTSLVVSGTGAEYLRLSLSL